MAFEVEQKFHVDDATVLQERLAAIGAIEREEQNHVDTYFNHPSRDFAETREAFRIRRVNGVPMVTYKGKKLPGPIKARLELEWRLDPGDSDGTKMEQLLGHLSFRRVASVAKRRRCFQLAEPLADMAVVIDDVDGLGCFAEIELVIEDSKNVESARVRIAELAERLLLERPEPRSYLSMSLERPTDVMPKEKPVD